MGNWQRDKKKEYILYTADELEEIVLIGTADEIQKYLGLKHQNTVYRAYCLNAKLGTMKKHGRKFKLDEVEKWK